MGSKLDMSNLTEEEAEHVLQVVQRDMQLRKTEEERLSELKQELDREESRCVLLSRQHGFNERCCIRCCSSFTFFLKPRRRCLDCRYNVCKRCCSYSETDKSWVCSACEKSRLLKTQSLEWFYSNVRRRFNRFGSAKVLKMLYRRHVGDQGSQADFTEGSVYAESTDDSVYDSDSTFYKHTEERSMAESISVALRVAKEAIDEAITKADKQTGNQKKQKEACYLRDNKGELIEELTTMILQTIICRRRDLSEMHTECDLEAPADENSNSAFSPLTDEILAQHDKAEQSSMLCTQGLKKDEVPAAASRNQNIDWMENSCASSVLQSPDGNWFALQSTQLSRLSLPTKCENLMFSALEKESGVISAYDGMASDTESDSDGAWGAALLGIHGKLSSRNLLNDDHTTSSQAARKLPINNPADQPQSDSDLNNPVPQIHKPSLPLLKRKVAIEDRHLSCQYRSAMGITTNPDGGESSEDGLEDNRVKRTRCRRRNKRDTTEGKGLRVCSGRRLSLSEPQDYGRMLLSYLLKCQSKRQSGSELLSDETVNADTPDSVTPDLWKSGTMTPDAFTPDVEEPNTDVLSDASDRHLTSTLRELANQVSATQPSRNGNDDMEEAEDERNEKEEKGEKEERENEKSEALSDLEMDVDQEHLETSEDEYQISGKELPDVKDNGIENFKSRDSENTNRIDNLNNEFLQGTIQKENATKIEKSARMPQRVCFDCKFEIKDESNEQQKSELHSTNNIDSVEQIRSTEHKASYMSKRMHGDQDVEQEKERKDTSECKGGEDNKPVSVLKHSVKNEAHIEPEPEGCLEPDEQREILVESCEKNEIVVSQEWRKQKNDTEHVAKSEEDSVDSTESEYSQDNQDFGEEENLDDKKITESVVKSLNIVEVEPEAHSCNTRYSLSDFTDESGKEKEEIIVKQKEQNQMTYDGEIGGHNEKINRDEQTVSVSDEENESSSNVTDKTEEQSCVSEQCNEHTLKDVLDCTPSGQEEFLSPEEIYKDVHLEKDLQLIFTLLQQKYSAASLRSITTEVLKVLNATEDLIQGAMGLSQSESWDRPALPPSHSKRLDEQISRIEENVYVAASAVFGLEAELGDLEECARSISGETTEEELSQLEEQVASAAAQVQQSELQVSDIAARIAALKNAGLNVAPQTRFAKPQTIDSSRKHRRRLPAPPVQGKKS